MPKIYVTLGITMEVPDDLHKSLQAGNDVAFDDLASSIAAKLVIDEKLVTIVDVAPTE